MRNEDGVMIAFLPANTEWCKQPLPHMTLVYAGAVEDRAPTDFNRLAKDAISVSRITNGFQLEVTGVEEFGGGDDEAVEVLTLHPTPALLIARKLVDGWNKSEHPFTPHATIGPIGSATSDTPIPSRLYFDRLLVAFGSKHLTFRLGDYGY